MDVGLSYIRLGQNATTLSGGEAQRVKLAKELSKRDTGKTFYILDEPTTGLHFEDIQLPSGWFCIACATMAIPLVIEHNLDVIKTADWIVDLGPEGAMAVARLSPLVHPSRWPQHEVSHTGRFLKPMLSR